MSNSYNSNDNTNMFRPNRSVTPPMKRSNLKTIRDYNLNEIYQNFNNPNAVVNVPEIDKVYIWARGVGHPMYVVRIRMITNFGLHTKTFDTMKGEVELFIPKEQQSLFYLPDDVHMKTKYASNALEMLSLMARTNG